MDFTPHHKIPLFQDDALFKMNTDTSALMKCMKVKKGDTVLDIGTNHGVVLLEASVYESSWITGIEINPLGIDLALKNMQLNHIHNVSLLCQDVTETKFDYKFDVVLSNPPYFDPEKHTSSETQAIQNAKFSNKLDFDALLKVIQTVLKPKGKAYIVYRSSMLAQCFKSAYEHHLSITHIQLIDDKRLSHYKTCVLTLAHGTNKPCEILKALSL